MEGVIVGVLGHQQQPSPAKAAPSSGELTQAQPPPRHASAPSLTATAAISDRPYHEAVAPARALAAPRGERGGHFDPALLDRFAEALLAILARGDRDGAPVEGRQELEPVDLVFSSRAR